MRLTAEQVIAKVRCHCAQAGVAGGPIVCDECRDGKCVLRCCELSPVVILKGETLSTHMRRMPHAQSKSVDCVIFGGWSGQPVVVLAELKSRHVKAGDVQAKFRESYADLIGFANELDLSAPQLGDVHRVLLGSKGQGPSGYRAVSRTRPITAGQRMKGPLIGKCGSEVGHLLRQTLTA